MGWKTTLTALLAMIPLLVVCTPHPATAYSAAGSQNRDVSFSWELMRGPDGLTIKGLARNNIHHKIYDLQLFAVALDENGKPAGKEGVFIGPPSLPWDQSQGFKLSIPGTAAVNAKSIRLEYRYHLPNYAERYWSWTYGRAIINPGETTGS